MLSELTQDLYWTKESFYFAKLHTNRPQDRKSLRQILNDGPAYVWIELQGKKDAHFASAKKSKVVTLYVNGP